MQGLDLHSGAMVSLGEVFSHFAAPPLEKSRSPSIVIPVSAGISFRTHGCKKPGIVVYGSSSHRHHISRALIPWRGSLKISEEEDLPGKTEALIPSGKPHFASFNLPMNIMENLQFQLQEMLCAFWDVLGLNHLLNRINGDDTYYSLVPQLAGGFSSTEPRFHVPNVFFARGPNIPQPSRGPPVTPTMPSGVPLITPIKREGIQKPAPSVNRWEEKKRIRKMMEERGIKKEPGLSRIEVNGKVHSFMANDRNHPELRAIHAELNRIVKEMYAAGYEPDTRFVLHDIDEAAKVRAINFHSEKLAMCYGFIKTPPKQTIRIVKNLRVCGDCHTATKYMSYLTGREIIMRDAFRFHHFKKGYCSCGDYW